MQMFTKKVIERHLSIEDIENELFLSSDGDSTKREKILLATVQELAGAVVNINKTLKFRN